MRKEMYEYYPGKCTICGKETDVRHKCDLWLIGSEGTDMCWPCEKEMLVFLRERSHYHIQKRKEEFKNAKNRR